MIRTYVITLSGWFMRVYTVYPRTASRFVDAAEFVGGMPPRLYRIERKEAAFYLNMARQNAALKVRSL